MARRNNAFINALNGPVAPKRKVTKATVVSVILPIGTPLLCRGSDGEWTPRKGLKQARYDSADILHGIGMPGNQAVTCEIAYSTWNGQSKQDGRDHDVVMDANELVSIKLPESSGYEYLVTHHKYMLAESASKKHVMFVRSDRSDEYWHVTLNESSDDVTACDCPGYIFQRGGAKGACKHMLRVKTIMEDMRFQKKNTP